MNNLPQIPNQSKAQCGGDAQGWTLCLCNYCICTTSGEGRRGERFGSNMTPDQDKFARHGPLCVRGRVILPPRPNMPRGADGRHRGRLLAFSGEASTPTRVLSAPRERRMKWV